MPSDFHASNIDNIINIRWLLYNDKSFRITYREDLVPYCVVTYSPSLYLLVLFNVVVI